LEEEKEGKIKLAIDKEIQKQLILYLVFAVLMIILNLLIQQLNELIAPTICANLGHVPLVQTFYCTETPDMSELVGQVLAVGITVITKFLLDKVFVFKTKGKIKGTSEEFAKYLFLSVLATIYNIGVQFILSNFFGVPMLISALISLSTGYLLRFPLDYKFTFSKYKEN
jgi:putative flippase GtrA